MDDATSEDKLIRVLTKAKTKEQYPRLYGVCLRNMASGHEHLYMGVHYRLEEAIERGKQDSINHFSFLQNVPHEAWMPMNCNFLTMDRLANEFIIGQVETYTDNEHRQMDTKAL